MANYPYPPSLDAALAPERCFMHLPDEYTAFESARVVVVPVPFDGTTCYQPGARLGPQAIIDASRNLELYDAELRVSPYKQGIHTLRAVEVINGDAEAMVERTEQVTGALLDQGKFVVTLGGDHLTSIGVIRAFARRYPAMSVLQLDAHTDLRDEYEGSRYSAATIMRRTLEVCPHTAQVGIRSISEEEMDLITERGLPVWMAADIHARQRRGDYAWIEEVVASLADEVYITFDVDAFDPSLLPGTGTPEAGGLGWYDALDLLAEVAQRKKIIGCDVVELSPLLESHTSPVIAAKLAYKLIGLATQG